ncbi:helix-turn-helix domain-containing protein [Lentilactobacillus kisonensis]|uniref:DNA-binding helix-turn-helix protein n=2 Tax=Lentilactobacillus kisonensis TaxID=481722 RepID=H1LFJ4_9LACO|nr:helix-turn-helix domain-containing protein [Lentilactobacillus kisonensis]EHO51709.1 DNA-binding helix-turn-helix protein [Lentilactobacillus kisonensis F0435]KRL22037.1 DNA-binding helix-turn-helix protein [Lentilactobacillus kisonensis DSM 19906 = JCM 15041]
MEDLAQQLKEARINRGLSQNEVATILHVSRQSISKWENGRGYPDIDNLISLSQLYQTSTDQLLKQNDQLAQEVQEHKTIPMGQNKPKQASMALYQNNDEGIILLILTLVSALVPIVGIFLPMYVLWRNNKYNSLHKTIIVVSAVVILISLVSVYVIISDNWLHPSGTKIYKIN